MNTVIVAISMDDGTLSIMEFLIIGRSPTLPFGAARFNDGSQGWARQPTDENIAAELKKSFPPFNTHGDQQPQPLGFKIVERADIPLTCMADRDYRNALKLDGVKAVYDMPMARDCHRELLRHERGQKLLELDGQWMRATGQGKRAEADAIEAERQRWRDAPADQRIEAAQTVEELKQIRVE